MFADSAIILDFETTGLRCDEGHRVTEVAALRIRGGRIAERFESLVNCDRRIPGHIVGFTGITQAMVDAAPPAARVFEALVDFIGTDRVIAHNAWFDQGFLAAECRRLNLAQRATDFICSFQIARNVLPHMKSHALGCLASQLRIPFTPGKHRAAVDATITANVIFRLCERIAAARASAHVDLDVLRELAIPRDRDAVVASAA